MGEDEWYIAMYAAPSAKLIDLAIAGHVPYKEKTIDIYKYS